MKPYLVAVIFSAIAALPGRAQVIISNFTDIPSLLGVDLTQDTGLSSGSWNIPGVYSHSGGILTIGGAADNAGSFPFADLTPFNATGLTQMSAVVRSNSGDDSSGFVVFLYDSSSAVAATATFNTTPLVDGIFTTLTASVAFDGGNIADITYYGLFGSGTSDPFRMSFDSISVAAVPEPATYVATVGVLALAFAAYRRRRISPLAG
jgi:hypothetical protein